MAGRADMDEVDNLYEQSLGELKELLDAEQVVGDAIETPQATVIPLFSTGFGFGAGVGSDENAKSAGGAGAGGGIKPVSVIIVGDDGVRVHRLTEGDAIERLAEAAGRGVDRMADRFGGRRDRPTEAPEAEAVPSSSSEDDE